jgi:hypothetical protein
LGTGPLVWSEFDFFFGFHGLFAFRYFYLHGNRFPFLTRNIEQKILALLLLSHWLCMTHAKCRTGSLLYKTLLKAFVFP